MRWLESWATLCFSRGWLILVILLTSTLGLGGYGFSHFNLNSDMDRVITPRDADSWFHEDDMIKRAFPQFRQTVVVVLSGDKAGEVSRATNAFLDRIPKDSPLDTVTVPNREPLLDSSWIYYTNDEDFNELIDAATALGATGGQLQSVGAVVGLLQGVTIARRANDRDSVAALSKLLTDAHGDRGGQGLITKPPQTLEGADGRFYELVVLKGTPSFEEQLPAASIVESIESWRQAIVGQHPTVSIALTGDLVLANEEINDALSGIKLAGTLSVLFLIVVIAFGVRCWRLTLGLLLLILIGSVWTHSLAMWTVGTYNTLSLAFVVMFFGLGVDFGLHYGLAVGESPGDKSAIAAAVRKTGAALGLSAVSTALAFLSFSPTEYTGLGELGIISALGMLVAFFLTLTLLPASFGVLGLPKPANTSPLRSKLKLPGPWLVIGLWLLLGAVGLMAARHASFDYSVAGMRNLQSPGMQVLEQLQQADLMTDYSISSLVDESNVGEVTDALERLPSVAYVASIDDYLPEPVVTSARRTILVSRLDALLEQWSFPEWTGDDLKQAVDGLYAIAQGDNTLADLEFINDLNPLELAQLEAHVQALLNDRRSWFAGLIDSPVPSRSKLSPATRANWVDDSGKFRLEVGPAFSTSSRQNIEQFVSEVRSVVPNAGGRSVIEFGVGSVVVRAFQQATILAGLGIVLILTLYYRGLLVPAIILSSLAITTTLTFAVMELLGLSLNMANVLVVPLILGLGIDSAIHVTHRYMVLGDSDSFIHSSTPRAVFLSAVTTVATFASLMSSSHQGAASLGQLLAIAIPIMVVVTFTLIPSLLELVPSASGREATNP